MSNLTRYSFYVDERYRDESSIDKSPTGEYVKFDDIKELLNTAHNSSSHEMPLLEEVYSSIQIGPYEDLSYREYRVVEACYDFISRHFGR